MIQTQVEVPYRTDLMYDHAERPLVVTSEAQSLVDLENPGQSAQSHDGSRALKSGIFSVCAPPPPAHWVHIICTPRPDERAIFLHDDLLCNGTCSVTGGSITYWGGAQTDKIPNLISNKFGLGLQSGNF